MLPKIETPIFDFSIPSTGEVKKFRPFLVKEEKVLMLASEGGEYKAVSYTHLTLPTILLV